MMSTIAIILTIFTSTCLARNTLLNWDVLQEGQSLDVGSYKFIMQEDCNLVLYDTSGPIWGSGTGITDKRGCKAVLESDGRLRIFDRDGNNPWNSKSKKGKGGHYALVLQEDRNVVIYGSDIWSTGTYVGGPGVVLTAMNGTVDAGFAKKNATAFGRAGARNTLLNWEELLGGESLEAGSYKFIMQEDCNLVLYDPSGPIWASNTVNKGTDCKTLVHDKGSLRIYDPHTGNKLWSSNGKKGKGQYVLVLQEDRNVVLYGSDVWSTGTHIRGAGVVLTAMNGTVDAGFAEENATAVVRK